MRAPVAFIRRQIGEKINSLNLFPQTGFIEEYAAKLLHVHLTHPTHSGQLVMPHRAGNQRCFFDTHLEKKNDVEWMC